jgi:hypothetical protein
MRDSFLSWSFTHLNWLTDSGKTLNTADGKKVEIWNFQHRSDPAILSEWATHFRNHYCSDKDIDFMRGSHSRGDYLNEIKFPSMTSKLGPAIRAGDFGEILVADYLEWKLNFWVPRVRWGSKMSSDESPKGCDVIGFRFHELDSVSEEDILAIFETKTKFSRSKINRLQAAVNDSAKDNIRIVESLNYIKQKLYELKNLESALSVDRFQNPVDFPYVEAYGAAVIVSDKFYSNSEILKTDTTKIPISAKSRKVRPHPNRDKLSLLLIKGPDLMSLVHDLYGRAADEA